MQSSKKNLLILVVLLGLFSCSNKQKNKYELQKSLAERNISKKEFAKNYKKEKIKIYSDKETKMILDQINYDMSYINELNKSDSLNLLGTPSLIKKEGPTEIWQYRNKNCILNIFWNNTNNSMYTIVSYNLDLKPYDPMKCFILQNSSN